MAETVSLNFDIDDVIDEVEEALEKSIAEGTAYAERTLRSRLPTRRTETAKAVTSQLLGTQGEVGVEFPANRRYRTRGTKTEQIVKRLWRSIESPTFAVIEKEFYDQIEE